MTGKPAAIPTSNSGRVAATHGRTATSRMVSIRGRTATRGTTGRPGPLTPTGPGSGGREDWARIRWLVGRWLVGPWLVGLWLVALWLAALNRIRWPPPAARSPRTRTA